jgi:outer membrane protein assembly factor BamD (BamD/ComL family)
MGNRSSRFLGLLFLALFALAGMAGAADQPNRAILVREAVIRIAPDASASQLGVSGRGREVVVLKESHDWLNVLAQLDPKGDATGWIVNKGVIRPSTPNGDVILFGEAAESEDEASRPHGRRGAAQDAMRLYARLAEYFPKSPLAGEALYRAADIRWQIERADVMSLPSSHEQDPTARPQINEDYMRQVMKKFPHSKWADLAAYHLLDNKVCGDWQAQSKCPERESELYERYAHDHPQSPRAAEALYQAAVRLAALIEIYKTENDPGRSAQAASRASAIAAQISTQFPQSDWAYKAAALAYKVRQNIPTYGNSRE